VGSVRTLFVGDFDEKPFDDHLAIHDHCASISHPIAGRWAVIAHSVALNAARRTRRAQSWDVGEPYLLVLA
jgi:hypothetical protein